MVINDQSSGELLTGFHRCQDGGEALMERQMCIVEPPCSVTAVADVGTVR
jgi:hypothetical protein